MSLNKCSFRLEYLVVLCIRFGIMLCFSVEDICVCFVIKVYILRIKNKMHVINVFINNIKSTRSAEEYVRTFCQCVVTRVNSTRFDRSGLRVAYPGGCCVYTDSSATWILLTFHFTLLRLFNICMQRLNQIYN